MWKLRHYWPLIAFIVPSLVIGYGVVLPCNGVTGWNSLSAGFAATIAGAALSYAAGIASALRTSCPARLSWRARVNRYINRQASNPHGIFGRLLAHVWRRQHRALNERTLDLLEISAGKRLLEIGCGPGEALCQAARRGASIVGLDVSQTMVSIAQRRNRHSVRENCVEVRLVRDGELTQEMAAFDAAFSVHCLYFWHSPERTLTQIANALKSGASLVLVYVPESDQVPPRFRDPTYRFYAPARVEEMLGAAGFGHVRTVRFSEVSEGVVWTIAEKKA